MATATAKVITLSTRLTTPAEKKTRSTLDVYAITKDLLDSWYDPICQRPLQINRKVRECAEEMKRTGVWPGIITLGVVDGKTYLLDGKHRKGAWELSGMEVGYAEVRILHCEDDAEMGREFVELNGRLVNMRPDDNLRGLEGSSEALREIRRQCPFVAYDQIRRNATNSPVMGMSQVLRCWRCSAGETPTPSTSGMSAVDIAKALTVDEVPQLITFLNLCFDAFGRDPEYGRLWGNLNMTLCMWLYRRLVLPVNNPVKRAIKIGKEQFKRCLMSLSANGQYLDWLVGRTMSDRDRSPAYDRIRSTFASRLREDIPGVKPLLPGPAWSTGKRG